MKLKLKLKIFYLWNTNFKYFTIIYGVATLQTSKPVAPLEFFTEEQLIYFVVALPY